MGRSPPLPHHPQRRRQRGTAGAQYAGSNGLININKDDALLHYLTGHYPISKTIEALAARNVDAFLVGSRVEALARLRELVPEGSEVFVNTSETLDAIGYTEYMHGNDLYINLHDQMMSQPDPASQREFRRKTTTADYFVGSVQAIAETGEIVIASGSGSQIGAYSYGARRVILVAGTQKICPTRSDAEARTRGFTLERHDRWLEGRGVAPTPIGKYLVMEHEPVAGRISMVLIPESIGW